MKYISYTFIDDATQIPVSIEPARKGPIMPEGVEYVFSIEDSFSTGVPIFFGTVDSGFEIKEWMQEYSEKEFINSFKNELVKRSSGRRKILLSQGFIEDHGARFNYSKATVDGLYSIVSTMMLDQEIFEVDFKTAGGWVKLSLIQAKEILIGINRNIQKIHSWNANIDKEIYKCSYLQDLLSIQVSIQTFTEVI